MANRSVAASLLVAALSSKASASEVTPVQSVINMLTDMQAKGTTMLADEGKVYEEYAEWVDDRSKELGFEITTEKNDIQKLIAFIDAAETKINELGDQIQGLDNDINRLDAEKKDADAVRASEKAEFLALETDYSESLDALARAIQVLSAQSYNRPQAMMLLQKMSSTTPGLRRVLAALAVAEESEQNGAPSTAAYEFQSGGIVQVLEELEAKFKGELDEVQKDESNKQHYFDLEVLHLSDTIARTTADRNAKAELKGATAAESAKAKGDLAVTKEELATDQADLADTKATFASKSATYEENQKVRKNEIATLAEAIEILSSPEVAGSYGNRINLAQEKPASGTGVLLQMRSLRHRMTAQQRAAALLKKRASKISSKVLASFAAQIAANPFEKVIGMIEGLLEKMQEEAAAEAEHKAWCDEQLKENKHKRNKLTASVNKLIAEIEETASNIATLSGEIDTLVKEQSDLAKAMEEATGIRSKEHAENNAIIVDAKAGQVAVKNALAVLRDFYSSQGAFVQRQAPAMEAYKGMQNSKGGPIGMLEVILTDFTRLEADTTAAEAQALKAYESFMAESQAAKKQKHEHEVADRLEKDKAEFHKNELKKDLTSTEQELGLASDYYGQLTPMCLTVPVSYEERVAKRKEELAALNEAYGILDQKR